ncbi:unnamed protein product, partial [Timema podura]|nr:unnamed protein product [Timema podura]
MRTKANISSMEGQQRSKINTLTWDATKLPLRDGVVDLFISDLPFGKRCGSKKGNPHLYTNVVREMARTAVPGTGRAVLLTHDTRSFCK